MENCINCSGLYGTPGTYKHANGQSWSCGYCKGSGMVLIGSNWAAYQPTYVPDLVDEVSFPVKKSMSLVHNILGVFVAFLMLSGTVAIMGVVYFVVAH